MKTQRPYTPEMAVDLLYASDVQVSPDGTLVAFVVNPVGHRETNATATIMTVPADGSSPPLPLTGRQHNNVSPRWSPDGKTIAFLSDREKCGEAQLYVVPAGGGEPLRLTNMQGGVSQPGWLPDGSGLTVSATRLAIEGTPAPESEINVASERPRPRGIVWVSTAGSPPVEVGPDEGHIWGYAVSPCGKRIATFSSTSDHLSDAWENVKLRVQNLQGDAPEHEIGPFNRPVDRVTWSPDGRRIGFIAARLPDARHERAWVVDTSSGEMTILDERGITQNWVGFDGDSILLLSVEGQRTKLDTTDFTGTSVERIELPDDIARCWLRSLDVSNDGRTMAFVAEPDTRPPDVWTTRDGGVPTRLTHLNPQLDDVALTNMEPLSWQSTDGTSIDGWLVRPPGEEQSTNLPLVVYVHGGPSMAWGNWFHGTWHDWAHNLAARGFAVLLPNPRGSTGRGGDFTSANQSDLGGGDFEDVMTGVDYLIERGIADENRLGIGGWSYGGFITAWAVGKTDRFKAAVAGAAVTNWVSKVGTTDIRQQNESNFPRPLHEDPDALWERSPIRYLNNIKTPTLIVHGEADPRVPISQGTELYLGLKAMGVDTELVTYPRQKHAFHERAFQLDLLQRMCDWYERYLL